MSNDEEILQLEVTALKRQADELERRLVKKQKAKKPTCTTRQQKKKDRLSLIADNFLKYSRKK